jgi:hypothetical protein
MHTDVRGSTAEATSGNPVDSAIKKVVPVVEQLSHEIVMGGNDWETVIVSFQK